LVLLSTVIDYNHEHLKRCICGAEPIPLQETSIDSQSTLDESQDYAQLESSINMQKRRHMCHELFFSFSLLQNIRKLLSTTKSKRTIPCLHGIRTLSMMWVILGHCYVFQAMLNSIGEFV
jgi:hypothetical protein